MLICLHFYGMCNCFILSVFVLWFMGKM